MLRAVLLLSLACLPVAGQTPTAGNANDGYELLFNGRDLDGWAGDPQQWKVERGLLTGTSDGRSSSALVLSGRDYGDFELRFDLRIIKGAGRVQMRGRGEGPLGVELDVGTSRVRLLVNGMPSFVVATVRPGEWNTYRIICKANSFDVFRNEVQSALTLVVGHLSAGGKLALILPAGTPSEIAFRNIRVKQ